MAQLKAFGTGVLGDWVCHILDPAFWALKLQLPESVLAANGGEYSPERFPTESVIEWNFPLVRRCRRSESHGPMVGRLIFHN